MQPSLALLSASTPFDQAVRSGEEGLGQESRAKQESTHMLADTATHRVNASPISLTGKQWGQASCGCACAWGVRAGGSKLSLCLTKRRRPIKQHVPSGHIGLSEHGITPQKAELIVSCKNESYYMLSLLVSSHKALAHTTSVLMMYYVLKKKKKKKLGIYGFGISFT